MVKDKDKHEQEESKEDIIEKAIPFSSINPSDEEQGAGNDEDSDANPAGEAADERGGNSVSNK